MPRKTFLPIDIKKFGFVEREKINGKYIKNKCGRDFLYYTLNYYYPNEFNSNKNNPQLIERESLFGLSLPFWLAWTQLQFIRVPRLFKSLNLNLKINNRNIGSFLSFFITILNPNKKSANQAMIEVEKSIKKGIVTGIDIALDKTGLFDHVVFVYGYDKYNFYVFDTHKVNELEYTKITKDNRYILKIPKKVVHKRWTLFSRVWTISKKYREPPSF